jgi:hypothetical protein
MERSTAKLPYSHIVLVEVTLISCLTLVLISLLFLKSHDCVSTWEIEQISTVSGFYGPGAYLGFVATSISAILCYEWLRPFQLLRIIMKQREQGQEQGDRWRTHVLKEALPSAYDASYVGMMAYFVIVWNGRLIQMFWKENFAQVLATDRILRTINILASIARCGTAVDSLLFSGGKIGPSSNRFLFWIIIPIVCNSIFLPEVLDSFNLFDLLLWPLIAFVDFFNLSPALVGVAIALGSTLINGVIVLSLMANLPLFGLLIEPCQLILLAWLQTAQPAKSCTYGTILRSMFPVSSSFLSDLDQAAALATGLLVALWPLVMSDALRGELMALAISRSPSPNVRVGNRSWIRNRLTW